MIETNDLFALALSLKVAIVATALNVIIGIPVAYILAKKKFFGKTLLEALITLPLVLPPTVVGFYLLVLVGRNGFIGRIVYDMFHVSIVFTWYAAALAAQVVSMPLMVRASKAAIATVDPEFENASYTLGKSKLDTIFKVTLPLAKKGIIAGIVLAFCRALGEFGATIMVAGNIPGKTTTMPIAIYSAFYASENRRLHFGVAILTIMSFAATFIVNGMEEKGVLQHIKS
ncbi:MAG: molybdate ABC transporter permease subunit [bacterium]